MKKNFKNVFLKIESFRKIFKMQVEEDAKLETECKHSGDCMCAVNICFGDNEYRPFWYKEIVQIAAALPTNQETFNYFMSWSRNATEISVYDVHGKFLFDISSEGNGKYLGRKFSVLLMQDILTKLNEKFNKPSHVIELSLGSGKVTRLPSIGRLIAEILFDYKVTLNNTRNFIIRLSSEKYLNFVVFNPVNYLIQLLTVEIFVDNPEAFSKGTHFCPILSESDVTSVICANNFSYEKKYGAIFIHNLRQKMFPDKKLQLPQYSSSSSSSYGALTSVPLAPLAPVSSYTSSSSSSTPSSSPYAYSSHSSYSSQPPNNDSYPLIPQARRPSAFSNV